MYRVILGFLGRCDHDWERTEYTAIHPNRIFYDDDGPYVYKEETIRRGCKYCWEIEYIEVGEEKIYLEVSSVEEMESMES